MKTNAVATAQAIRSAPRLLTSSFAMTTMLLLISPAVQAAGEGPYQPSEAVSFEEVPGSDVKRVLLKKRAAERLGIEVGEVGEQTIELKQILGGLIVSPAPELRRLKLASRSIGGIGRTSEAVVEQTAAALMSQTASDETWLKVTLSKGEWERMRKEDAVRVLPLPTRARFEEEVFALPSGGPAIEDSKRKMLTAYYVISSSNHRLSHDERVRVEVPLKGTGKPRTVVPYSAVYYDGVGAPWVYVVVEPLVYERQRVEIERITRDLAVITHGPPLGTQIVTTGAALLYGAEVIYKR